jgi:hypothetical protein
MADIAACPDIAPHAAHEWCSVVDRYVCAGRPLSGNPDTVRSMALDPVDAREISRAAKQAQTWLAKRDELIRAAAAKGAGPRELGRAAALTHPSIIKIVERGRQADE